MADIDAAIAAPTKPDAATGLSQVQQRDARAQAWSKEAMAQAWPKYEALIDRAELDSFMKSYHGFLDNATRLSDKRTEDVVAWLRSNALQDALTEFHLSVIEDGLVFEATVGTLIVGITSSPEGHTYINELVEEAKCSERNLIWRAISFNQREAGEELNLALVEIKSSEDKNFTEIALATAKDSIKYFAKLGQLVTKALSLHNALRKQDVKLVSTGGLEKLLLTVGGMFMKPFVKKGADKLSGWLVHGLILVRCGSEYKETMNLLFTEAKFARMDRADTLLLLSMGREMAQDGATSGRKLLLQKWADLVMHAEIPKENSDRKLAGGFNEARELRFAMVATILQMVYVGKLLSEVADTPEKKIARRTLGCWNVTRSRSCRYCGTWHQSGSCAGR